MLLVLREHLLLVLLVTRLLRRRLLGRRLLRVPPLLLQRHRPQLLHLFLRQNAQLLVLVGGKVIANR
jgi:hypothetical protein